MPRTGDQARQRLQLAALELYRERGYDATTTAQIAERAGVTERTFFRHFPDKREVLFDGEALLRADLERGVADAPAGLGPLDVLQHSFRNAVLLLRSNRPFAEPRQIVIAATPALRERALTKEASLTQVLVDALQRRGVVASRATLAARIGMAGLSQATLAWLDGPANHPDNDLDELLSRAFDDLRALTAG